MKRLSTAQDNSAAPVRSVASVRSAAPVRKMVLGPNMALVLIMALLPSLVMTACARNPSQGKTSLTLAGSTSVQPFAEMLAEEYGKRYPDRPAINVQGGGSSAGASAALTGAAQIGMLSRALGQGEGALVPVVVARDAIALVAHPSSPVNDLTAAQVKSIFSGVVTDWSEVGGPPGKIHVVSREEGSGTRSAFDELVMKGAQVLPRAIIQDSNGAVRQTVAQDKMGFGYISLGLVDQSVKAVAVNGVQPTVGNCRAGTYTLVRPFIFASDGPLSPDAKAFVDYVLGDEGQTILKGEGLIPPR